MKYLHEFRDAGLVAALAEQIKATVTRPWTLMEVCGGQTHSIVKYALDQLLPEQVELVHGPGCPVCVTPAAAIDRAIALAGRSEVIFCAFGDMLRVPGSSRSLQDAKAAGADVRMLYSPLDALTIARDNPDRQVVFFAVGFETTAPAIAMALVNAKRQGLTNFFVLASHFLVPPAMRAIVEDGGNVVQGFLAPGHVCAVSGIADYAHLAARYRVPIVITGFEPADILRGILACVQQLERGEARADNQYRRVAGDDGNPLARQMVSEVFEPAEQEWRGIGTMAHSGLRLTAAYRQFDGASLAPGFSPQLIATDCISGEILRGLKKPPQCPHFGTTCRPEHPRGAPMVSSEGACAAYFHYQQP